eukprot:TRINITY_DN757_c0_g1_i1.p1 TRINITY_DN757_c0_g1~~TRINITY_DN757_c0_g1_i1.p1  ORF type:complete len:910 (-),score=236.24 TRINITY_DN757_c0_g1_i1:44-2773(-)
MENPSSQDLDEVDLEEHVIPEAAWTRALWNTFPAHKEFSVSALDGMRLAKLGYRMYKYVKAERTAGRVPIMDPFNSPKAGPIMGVPIGGIGSGSIGRGWRGDFARWTITPTGLMQLGAVEADQFSVRIKREDTKPITTTLYPGRPKSPILQSAWEWKVTGLKSNYYALFPRAWTTYQEPDPNILLTCRQVSPVIPNNYQETSYPVGMFIWTIENKGDTDAEISLMFTFQNGTGAPQDSNGGHNNVEFRRKVSDLRGSRIGDDTIGETVGVRLDHSYEQICRVDGGAPTTHIDPYSFGIAARASGECQVSTCPLFLTNNFASCKQLWEDFKDDGELTSKDYPTRISAKGETVGAAVCAKVKVPKGETKEVVFSLGWDAPITRFSSGEAYFKRYTKFYGHAGDAVESILSDAMAAFPDWEYQILNWQKPILMDHALPNYYKMALFNELYYLVDGGTVWTLDPIIKPSHPKVQNSPNDEEYGHFAYLEGLEYRMYNTYDVHFYASFALIQLWPKLELSLQRDIAWATMQEYSTVWTTLHSGKRANRKTMGAVPHDVGNPGEDPWRSLNSYCIQDICRWKDLPCKFVLQIYRDFIFTQDKEFLNDVYPTVVATVKYAMQFDSDGDGILDNEGFPDQTYDTWSAVGCSAYTGGLWLACLAAAKQMAIKMDDHDNWKMFHEIFENGKINYEKKLWNGSYYDYDSSKSVHHDSIMADMMAGQWYTKACDLEQIVPEENAWKSLHAIFDYNVKGFQSGNMGALNGCRPNGRPDFTCMQSCEVWTGTTYGLAAAMLHQGMPDEAFETAKGVIFSTYETLGYMFQTPEAWDLKGNFRACAYMRPLSIWAMQWAWDRMYTLPDGETHPVRDKRMEKLKGDEMRRSQSNGTLSSEELLSSRTYSTPLSRKKYDKKLSASQE